jgi:2-polyprenyl-3-methyl-5-hydroxy-6-metoxy-1,4-benzoquinol methylase
MEPIHTPTPLGPFTRESLRRWSHQTVLGFFGSSLLRNHRTIDAASIKVLQQSLTDNYFKHLFPEGLAYLESATGRADMQQHLDGRLVRDRFDYIPWLANSIDLATAEILEIGAGTGASTIALAEQGARVTAVDVDRGSLKVAFDRVQLYGLSDRVNFVERNAADLGAVLQSKSFDLIIFFAALEHMTHAERITAMSNTWQSLKSGSMWCILETPNRLWYYDDHTSMMPFYHWLDDELAFDYSKFSPRAPFNRSFRNRTAESLADFRRHGRGVSFHEFDLTLGAASGLDVVSCLNEFRVAHNPAYLVKRWLLDDLRYEKKIRKLHPERLHPGFFKSWLDMIIRKP